MADFIYTMETRLTPEQQRFVALVQEIARPQGINLYLTGGTIRDLISGFPIRDIDLTMQANPLKLQKDLERAGAIIEGVDDETKCLYLSFPGNVRAELGMAHIATYDKPGKPPRIAPGTITDDLRHRDFTVNAIALSLNPGSRGLLLDPFNGVADIEAKLLRILHNYAFLEEPSLLIRATRFAARFHWVLEERTQARYNAAKENNYIEYISDRAIGHEIEQLAYEDDPLHILRALEKEGWLKVLNPHWTVAKVDTAGLAALMKTRQQMTDFGYNVDPAPAVMHFITRRLSANDVKDIQKLIPRRQLVESWRNLESEAARLGKQLKSKEAATPSGAWKLLESSKPEALLFLDVVTRDQSIGQKIKNFFGKWRQMRQKLPLPEMAEMRITPALPEYPKIEQEAFYLLLDGKLRSRTEIQKFLKPYSPPPPPPPPAPARRGRGAKGAAVPAAPQAIAAGAATPAGRRAAAAKSDGVGAAKQAPGAAAKSVAGTAGAEKEKKSRPAAALAEVVSNKLEAALHASAGTASTKPAGKKPPVKNQRKSSKH